MQCPVSGGGLGICSVRLSTCNLRNCDSREPARCRRSKALARHQTVAYNPRSLMRQCDGGHSIPPSAMFE